MWTIQKNRAITLDKAKQFDFMINVASTMITKQNGFFNILQANDTLTSYIPRCTIIS